VFFKIAHCEAQPQLGEKAKSVLVLVLVFSLFLDFDYKAKHQNRKKKRKNAVVTWLPQSVVSNN